MERSKHELQEDYQLALDIVRKHHYGDYPALRNDMAALHAILHHLAEAAGVSNDPPPAPSPGA